MTSVVLLLLLAAAAWCVVSFTAYACTVASARRRPAQCECRRRVAVTLPAHLGGDKVATLCPDCGRQRYYAAYIFGTGNSRSRSAWPRRPPDSVIKPRETGPETGRSRHD